MFSRDIKYDENILALIKRDIKAWIEFGMRVKNSLVNRDFCCNWSINFSVFINDCVRGGRC